MKLCITGLCYTGSISVLATEHIHKFYVLPRTNKKQPRSCCWTLFFFSGADWTQRVKGSNGGGIQPPCRWSVAVLAALRSHVSNVACSKTAFVAKGLCFRIWILQRFTTLKGSGDWKAIVYARDVFVYANMFALYRMHGTLQGVCLQEYIIVFPALQPY